jgi:hypothetical protein
MTLNPIVAGLLAARILGGPMTFGLIVGTAVVGVWLFIATIEGAA